VESFFLREESQAFWGQLPEQEKLKNWRAKLKHDVSQDETCGSGSGSNSIKIPQGDMRRQEQTKAARTLANSKRQRRESTSDSH
jgi:hypothetical protein